MSVVLPQLRVDLPHLPRALCRGQDPDAWFSTDADMRDAAAGGCRACPERAPCLRWALTRGERYGVRGAGQDASQHPQSGAAAG